jgi:hypothetical protein
MKAQCFLYDSNFNITKEVLYFFCSYIIATYHDDGYIEMPGNHSCPHSFRDGNIINRYFREFSA